MAIIKWQGGVTAVAQVDSGSVDTYDAASTYTVTIGDFSVSVAGDTDVATTGGNLVTALNAETHPYFAAITWSGTGTITATADVAGAPFTAALTVSGGTGTVTDFSTGTACTGPHHANALDNWAGGALPTTSDDVVIDAGPSILYGLDAIDTTALGRAEIRQSFTGLIGLEPTAFATSLDGATTDSDAPEYRSAYLELTADEIVIGEHIGPGAPNGSARLCVEQKKAGTSILDVQNTASTAINSRPAVRFLASHASAEVNISRAPAGVGIAQEADETATVGDITVSDTTTASACYVGQGVTLSTYTQYGGLNMLSAAATITTVTTWGGQLDIVGYDFLITTLNVYRGEVNDRHINTAANEWTTINLLGGTLALPSVGSRTYGTLNLDSGRVEADYDDLTGTEAFSGVGRRDIDIVVPS